jgi:diacylglycerol O-acyltransferase
MRAARHPMAHTDAAWLRMDSAANQMVVNGVLWFDEPLDWDRFEERFRETVLDRFDRFHQRPVEHADLRAPEWEEDPGFDPHLHIHRRTLPAPGDERALKQFVGDHLAVPLDRSRPLWEAYLLDGYGKGSAVLVRIHHSVADGIALGRVLLGMVDGGEPPSPVRPRQDGQASRGVLEALVHEGVETVRNPRHGLALTGAALRDARTLAKLLMPGADPPTAIHGDLGVAHRVGWSAPVDLWRCKHAAKALGATINDVLVAAVTGAVADYLREHDGAPAEVHALVPVNLRAPGEPLDAELGNRFGLVLLGLPVGIDEPVLRALEVKRRMDAIKRGHEAPITLGILSLMGRTPAPLEARLIDFFSAKGSMVLTNVPGPRRPLQLTGRRLDGILVWAPCSGSVGMSVTIFSYAGKVTVGFMAAQRLVPDPQVLADGFRAELLTLARLTRPARPRGRRGELPRPRA